MCDSFHTRRALAGPLASAVQVGEGLAPDLTPVSVVGEALGECGSYRTSFELAAMLNVVP